MAAGGLILRLATAARRLFLRLYERLPEARLYRTDSYRVYGWLPADRH